MHCYNESFYQRLQYGQGMLKPKRTVRIAQMCRRNPEHTYCCRCKLQTVHKATSQDTTFGLPSHRGTWIHHTEPQQQKENKISHATSMQHSPAVRSFFQSEPPTLFSDWHVQIIGLAHITSGHRVAAIGTHLSFAAIISSLAFDVILVIRFRELVRNPNGHVLCANCFWWSGRASQVWFQIIGLPPT